MRFRWAESYVGLLTYAIPEEARFRAGSGSPAPFEPFDVAGGEPALRQRNDERRGLPGDVAEDADARATLETLLEEMES